MVAKVVVHVEVSGGGGGVNDVDDVDDVDDSGSGAGQRAERLIAVRSQPTAFGGVKYLHSTQEKPPSTHCLAVVPSRNGIPRLLNSGPRTALSHFNVYNHIARVYGNGDNLIRSFS